MILDFNNLPESARDLRVVFFDLDNTLTDEDTDFLWARWRISKNPLAWVRYYELVRLYHRYRRGVLKSRELMRFQRRRIGLRNQVEFKALCRRFFIEVGKAHIFKAARPIIDAHRRFGSKVVMITAQHDLIGEPFAHYLDMDDTIGAQFIEKGPRFKGAVMPFCFKEGKKYWAEQYVKNIGADLKDCGFYSDSRNDIPLLEAVSFAVATNPDPALKKIALEKNWYILNLAETLANK